MENNGYVVKMDGGYMNWFPTYTEAAEFREWLEGRYKNSKVEIVEG